jgi:tetratricopeptide (TPR) repeat protein
MEFFMFRYLTATFLFVLLIGAVSVFSQIDVENFLKKGEEFARQNKLPEAVAELTKAINLQPDNAEYYLKRAEMNFGIPNYEAVAEDVNFAVRLKPDDQQTILTAARFLRNTRKCSDARDLLDSYIKRQKAGDDIFYARSHSKMCLDDWFGAYQDLLTASDLAPHNSHYRTTLAAMLSKLGDSKKSLEQFERLIKFYEEKTTKFKPNDPIFVENRELSEIYRLRANVFHQKGNETAEFSDLAKSIYYSRRDFNYRIRAKIYADHEMYAEAVSDYTEALKNTLNPAIFLFERGDIYVLLKKYNEAIKDYSESAQKDAGIKDLAEQRITRAKQLMKRD